MIPFIQAPQWEVAGITIQFFGLMAVCALIFGLLAIYLRANYSLIPKPQALEASMWVAVVSLVTSHFVALIAYQPQVLLNNPSLLLDITGSMSSLGGMLGGGVASVVICRRLYGWSQVQTWSFLDLLSWGFLIGHFFGRLGCALAHDHIGIESDAFLAVRFPEGPSYDLGLLEWLWINICILFFWVLSKRPHEPGFYVLCFLITHGSVRFLLDFLRIEDARYLGLTPAQYACIALVFTAICIATRRYQQARVVPVS